MLSQSSEEYFEILRYIKGSLGEGILYGHNEHLNISAYCDAVQAGLILQMTINLFLASFLLWVEI